MGENNNNRVVLIFGAGPNLGAAIAAAFSKQGYKVAQVARSIKQGYSETGDLQIQGDLLDPTTIHTAFETTKREFGIPNVVVYNGANRLTTPPDDPLSATLETLELSRKVGFDGAFLAAQEALQGFRTLPKSTPTAFIYTGNTLSQIAIPGVMPFALGKVSAAMLIEYAANAYGNDGYRFYYTDERQPNGRPAATTEQPFVDASAHAALYVELAHEAAQSKWLVTFTKGLGRRDIVGVDFNGETREDYDRKSGRL